MSERLKYERFLWFHARVKAGRHPNSRHLVEEFEISQRTALRDIEFMRDRLRAPLAFDRGRNGYFYTDDSFELPAQWFSEENVMALALAVRLSSTIPRLYGVETKVLNQAVKRNQDRFPEDFMFQLDQGEAGELTWSQFVTLKRGQNIKYLPHAFTENGVAMLSSVLNSQRAIQVNMK